MSREKTNEKGALCTAYLKGYLFYPGAVCKLPTPLEVLKSSLETLSWLQTEQKSADQLQILFGWSESEAVQNEIKEVTPKHLTAIKTGEVPGGMIVKIPYNQYSARTYFAMFKDGVTVRGFKIMSNGYIVGEQGSDYTYMKELRFYVTATIERGDVDALQYVVLQFKDYEVYDDRIDSVKAAYDIESAAANEVRNIQFVNVAATGTSISFKAIDTAFLNVDDLEVGAAGAADLYIYNETGAAAIIATDLAYSESTEEYTATVPALTPADVLSVGLKTPDITDNFVHTPENASVTVS